MSTTTLYGGTEADAARTLIGGDVIGDNRNELLRQILVATANRTGGGGGGGIGGSTGATDNAILRANGTGGSTLQNSAVTIADNGNMLISGATSFSVPMLGLGATNTGIASISASRMDLVTDGVQMLTVDKSAYISTPGAIGLATPLINFDVNNVANGRSIQNGTAAPEGAVTANPGSLYCRSNAGAGELWKKESGTGNTGWVQVAGLSAPTLAGINSITSATGQALTLATLDGNANINLTPHGTGAINCGNAALTCGAFTASSSITLDGLLLVKETGRFAFLNQGLGWYSTTGLRNYLDTSQSTGDMTLTLGDVNSKLVITGGLSVGGGAGIKKILSASATLDFGSVGIGSYSDLTITVTGAAVNDCVILGLPNGSVANYALFNAWVSAADTVTVRYYNGDTSGAVDPASGTFRATVINF